MKPPSVIRKGRTQHFRRPHRVPSGEQGASSPDLPAPPSRMPLGARASAPPTRCVPRRPRSSSGWTYLLKRPFCCMGADTLTLYCHPSVQSPVRAVLHQTQITAGFRQGPRSCRSETLRELARVLSGLPLRDDHFGAGVFLTAQMPGTSPLPAATVSQPYRLPAKMPIKYFEP